MRKTVICNEGVEMYHAYRKTQHEFAVLEVRMTELRPRSRKYVKLYFEEHGS